MPADPNCPTCHGDVTYKRLGDGGAWLDCLAGEAFRVVSDNRPTVSGKILTIQLDVIG